MKNISRIVWIAALVIGMAVAAAAQVPVKIGRLGPINTPNSVYIDLRGTGVTSHSMYWYVDGTLTGCSVQLISPSADSVLIGPQDCHSTSTAPVTGTGLTDDAEIEVTSVSGTGLLRVVYEGNTDSSGSQAQMASDIHSLLTDSESPSPTQLLGQIFIMPGKIVPGVIPSTSAITGTTSTLMIPGTASFYMYVTGCQLSNTNASTDTTVQLEDGFNGTVIGEVIVPHGLGNNPAVFGAPIPVPTLGNGLYIKPTVGATVFGNCQSFISTTKWF